MINFQVICEFSGERNYVQLCDNMTLYMYPDSKWYRNEKKTCPFQGKCRIISSGVGFPPSSSLTYRPHTHLHHHRCTHISIYTSERDKRYWNDLISHKTLQNLPLMFICLFGNSWNHLPKTVGICLFNAKLGGSLKGDRIYFQAHTTSCAWGGYVGMFFPCLSSNTWYCWNGYSLRIYMGVSVNGGTPISHPKMIIFSRKTPWLLGTGILGNIHMC